MLFQKQHTTFYIFTQKNIESQKATAFLKFNYEQFIWVKLTSTLSSEDCPGKVDQKNPLQSGSSNIYGRIRVSNRMQFNTEV